jgi:subtilisin family serine protease
MAWVDNLEWDRAIEAHDGVAIGTGLEPDDPDSDGCESLEVLYRPQELLVAGDVWEEKGNPLRRRIDAIGGRPLAEFPRDDDRDPRRAATAERLGLRLVWLPDHDPLGLLRDLRRTDEFDIDGASVNHVTIAGPQRHGGDSPPVAVEHDTVEIPPKGVQEGSGVRIAVLDTGLVKPEPAGFVFEKRGSEDDDPFPPAGLAVGHGTLVAGVIATYAPAATLVIRRVLDTPLGEADELEIGQALLDVAREEPHIVNASFSGFAVDRKTMLAFRAAVEQVAKTILLVAAVGNEGLARRAYMAAFEGVCGVASVERKDDGELRIADYSNRGDYVEFCAEGTDVESTYTTGHAIASGTSFAAPKVSAALAITMSREGKSAHEAADQLRNDAAQPVIPQAGRFVEPR